MSTNIKNGVFEYKEKDFLVKRHDALFLKAVDEIGGEADTTQIRLETGLTRNQVNHRFRRLEDIGFIEVDQATKSRDGGKPPKKAIITAEGKDVLQKSRDNNIIEYSANPHEIVDDVNEFIGELENRVDALQDKIDEVESRMDETPEGSSVESELEYLNEWVNIAEYKIKMLEKNIERLRDDVDNRIDSLDEKIESEIANIEEKLVLLDENSDSQNEKGQLVIE